MKIFYLPDLGEGLAEAEIREWYVAEGDEVKVDQPLLSMETAKAVVDVPSPCNGRIEKLYGKVHDFIKTHAPLVEFVGEDKGSIVGKLEESQQALQEESVIIGTVASGTSVKAPPLVRALAKQLSVDLNAVNPSGPKGQITAEDIKRHAKEGVSRLTQGEALHGVRRAMAQTMGQAHAHVALVTLVDDVDLASLPLDADLTVLILQAMVAGFEAEPALNAWFDGKSLERQLFTDIHIGLAMDSPQGLFVPVLKQVNRQSAESLREKINYFKKAVSDRTVKPSEMQEATISLSNFGTLAGKYATPLVVPPMVAILGCGRVHQVPVVRDNKVIVSRILPLSLSVDHRAVTGGEAARFLAAVKAYLEKQS